MTPLSRGVKTAATTAKEGKPVCEIQGRGGGGEVQRAVVQYENGIEAAKAIMREEGWRGFTRGATPRVLLCAPAVAISWTVYEGVKSLCGD